MNAKDASVLLHYIHTIAKAAGVTFDEGCRTELYDALTADEQRLDQLQRDVERLEQGTGNWRERR